MSWRLLTRSRVLIYCILVYGTCKQNNIHKGKSDKKVFIITNKNYVFVYLLFRLTVLTGHSFSHKHGQKHSFKNLTSSSGDKTCLSPHQQKENVYEEVLEKGKVDLKEQNEYVYKLVKFEKPQVLLGWQISGKGGMLNATGRERRGLVTEYKIKFLTRSGDWACINNSRTGKEIFKSLGNLARPDAITKVDLANPITTSSLRVYPQLWDGIPYYTLSLNLCYPEFMATNQKQNHHHHNAHDDRNDDEKKHHYHHKSSSEYHDHDHKKIHYHHKKHNKANSQPDESLDSEQTNELEKSEQTEPNPSDDSQLNTADNSTPTDHDIQERQSTDQQENNQDLKRLKKEVLQVGKKAKKELKKAESRKPDHEEKKTEKKRKSSDNIEVNNSKRESNDDNHKIADTDKNTNKDVKHSKQDREAVEHRQNNRESEIGKKERKSTENTVKETTKNDFEAVIHGKQNRGAANQKLNNRVTNQKQTPQVDEKHDRSATDQKPQNSKAVEHKKNDREVKNDKGNNNLDINYKTQNLDTVGHKKNDRETLIHEKHGNRMLVHKTQAREAAKHEDVEVDHKTHDREVVNDKKYNREVVTKMMQKLGALNHKTIDLKDGDHKKNHREAVIDEKHKYLESNKTTKRQNEEKNESAIKPEPAGSVNSRTTTLAPIVTIGSTEKKLTQKEHACKDSRHWRYSRTNTPPKDIFSAVGDVHQAWRAMGGLQMEPFLFNLNAKNKHKKTIKNIFLQVSFKKLNKVFKIKVGGKGLSPHWGCITKFAILYKMESYMDWVYYRDEYGAAKVFDMGKKSKTSCGIEQTFTLPDPIITSDIRIYPQKWSGKPFIRINFFTCTLEGITCVKSLLAGGKLQRIQYGEMDSNLQQRNTAYFISVQLNSKDKLTRVKAVRFQPGPIGNTVAKFVLQYHDEEGKPHSVNDKDGEIVVYSTDDIVHKNKPMTVFFSKPIVSKSIRVYPQAWKGSAPSLRIDFLGCDQP